MAIKTQVLEHRTTEDVAVTLAADLTQLLGVANLLVERRPLKALHDAEWVLACYTDRLRLEDGVRQILLGLGIKV